MLQWTLGNAQFIHRKGPELDFEMSDFGFGIHFPDSFLCQQITNPILQRIFCFSFNYQCNNCFFNTLDRISLILNLLILFLAVGASVSVFILQLHSVNSCLENYNPLFWFLVSGFVLLISFSFILSSRSLWINFC